MQLSLTVHSTGKSYTVHLVAFGGGADLFFSDKRRIHEASGLGCTYVDATSRVRRLLLALSLSDELQ